MIEYECPMCGAIIEGTEDCPSCGYPNEDDDEEESEGI